MKRKVFDVNCKEDMELLWSILPEEVVSVAVDSKGMIDIEYECTIERLIQLSFAFNINWRDKKEIRRPVDESEWIGKLCWFWDDCEEQKVFGLLEESSFMYHTTSNHPNRFTNCRPLTLEEWKGLEPKE